MRRSVGVGEKFDGTRDELRKGPPVDSKEDGGDKEHAQEGYVGGGELEGRFVRALGEEHGLYYPRVIVEGDHAVQNPHHRQPVELLSVEDGREEVELPDEARRGGYAGEREEKNGHGDSEERGPPAEARVIGYLFAVEPVGCDDDHQERPQVHYKVNHEVKEHGAKSVGAQEDKPHENVSRMGDARIRQEAFNVVLVDGREVPYSHGAC